MFKKLRSILGIFLAVVLVSSAFVAFKWITTKDAPVAATQTTLNEGPRAIADDGVILHCWNWSFNTIANNMQAIRDAGYTCVQTSPIQGTKEATSLTKDWWVLYQPTNFQIGNSQLGSRADFAAMCAKAEEYGIKVIVDVVANHTGNAGGGQLQVQPSPAVDPYIRNNASFWHPAEFVGNYDNRWQVTQYGISLPDLNTENQDLQNMIIGFLNDCVACGADGFRFDAAKHIALPEDSTSSNFWPRVLGSINNKNNIFIYGEVLQGGADNYATYTKYMDVTASTYGEKIRQAVGHNSSKDAQKMFAYCVPSGVTASQLVTFVETHDTYANDQNESTYMNDWQLKMGWAMIAARANSTPLFFNRPTGSSKLAGNMGGTGTNLFKDADVVAVNKFHNAMVGEGEYIRYQGTNIALIERGSKGVVIVNLDGNAYINSDTTLPNGTYTNTASTGGTFTVANGKITGNIQGGAIAVLYASTPIDNDPTVSILDSATRFTDSMSVTLKTSYTSSATYSINGSAAVVYYDGESITFGGNANAGDVITLTLNGIGTNGKMASKSYSFEKVQPSEKKVIYLQLPNGWNTPNVYVYDESGLAVIEEAKWPGKVMTSEGNGLYSYTLNTDMNNPLVIFNDGSNQTPAATKKGFALTLDKMIYADGVWKEYKPVQPPIPDPVSELKVYLQNLAGWGTPNVYIYEETVAGIKTVAEWPGVQMQNEGNGLYSYTLPEGYSSPKIIFNSNGNQYPLQNQPGLVLDGVMIYTNGEWKDYTGGEVNTTIKASIQLPYGWKAPNIYVYKNVNGVVKELAKWPGVPMDKNSDGTYSYTALADEWSGAFVIFNDGNNQTPGSGQQGFLWNSSMIYTNGAWQNAN